MNVIGHQHVRVQGAVEAPGGIPEFPKIPKVVVFGDKARLAIIAALNDMLRDPWQVEPWLASHPTFPRTRARALLCQCEQPVDPQSQRESRQEIQGMWRERLNPTEADGAHKTREMNLTPMFLCSRPGK